MMGPVEGSSAGFSLRDAAALKKYSPPLAQVVTLEKISLGRTALIDVRMSRVQVLARRAKIHSRLSSILGSTVTLVAICNVCLAHHLANGRHSHSASMCPAL